MELTQKTIGQCLRERAQLDGNRTGFELDSWSCTFRELYTITDHLSLEMSRRGIGRGTHVGIWGTNSMEWIMTFLALTKLGAIPVLFNTHYKEDEMRDTMLYSEVEFLYYGKENKGLSYESVVQTIKNDLPKVKEFLTMKEHSFDFSTEELTLKERDYLEALYGKVTCQDTACMIFTSGTTSRPKAVMLTHYNLVNNAAAMAEKMRWNKQDRMCLVVPLFHCFGITASLLPCILTGMILHLVPHFRTARIWEALTDRRCTVINGVPSMFLALLENADYKMADTRGIKSGLIAGAPVTEQDYMRICERFSRMHLQPAYGQTEASPCISLSDWGTKKKKKANSVGRILEHMEVRIMDVKTNKEVKGTKPGEIQVRGYNIMKGYYNMSEETNEAFTEDGFLKTGDIGRFDRYGNLSITGRIKEIIIRSGENISPAEIENEIRKMEEVREVKVLGVPSAKTQEAVAACLILKDGYSLDTEKMTQFLKERLAHYKVPEYFFQFEEFPMNASGKIHLSVLKTEAALRSAATNE